MGESVVFQFKLPVVVGRGQSINQSTAFHSIPTVTVPLIFGQRARSLVVASCFLQTLKFVSEALILRPQMQLCAISAMHLSGSSTDQPPVGHVFAFLQEGRFLSPSRRDYAWVIAAYQTFALQYVSFHAPLEALPRDAAPVARIGVIWHFLWLKHPNASPDSLRPSTPLVTPVRFPVSHYGWCCLITQGCARSNSPRCQIRQRQPYNVGSASTVPE